MAVCKKCGYNHSRLSILEQLNCDGPSVTRHTTALGKPVTPSQNVTDAVTPDTKKTRHVTNPVTHVNPITQKHCPTCRCEQIYSNNAERQRAYRERKRASNGNSETGAGKE